MPKRKRVTSYREYVSYLAHKVTLESGMILFYTGSILFAIAAILGIVGTLALLVHPNWRMACIIPLISTLITGFCTWALYMLGSEAGKSAARIEAVIPPTRQNIEQLPVEETLVRASQAPAVGQKMILLRPVSASTEKAQQELLRPHGG